MHRMLAAERRKNYAMYTAKDPLTSGQTTIVLLWIWLATQCAAALSSLWAIVTIGGYGGAATTFAGSRAVNAVDGWTAGVAFVVFLATAITVLRWIMLTNRNAQTWSDQVTISPGWAAGWFFVPFANLIKPFEGVAATWRATVAPDDIDSVGVPTILRWWWGLWVASSIWGNVAFRLSLDAETTRQLVRAHAATIAGLAIDVPLTIVLVRIVARLSTMQSQVLASLPDAEPRR